MSENLLTLRSTETFRNAFQVTSMNNSNPTDDTDELPEWQIQIFESNLQFFFPKAQRLHGPHHLYP